MNRRIAALALCAALLADAGCWVMVNGNPVTPPFAIRGMTRVKTPVDTAFDHTRIGDKVGTATARSVLGWFAWGDASIQEAARNGGLTRVDHVDAQMTNILFGIYQSDQTIAYGE